VLADAYLPFCHHRFVNGEVLMIRLDGSLGPTLIEVMKLIEKYCKKQEELLAIFVSLFVTHP
jgi:hypothetical protein